MGGGKHLSQRQTARYYLSIPKKSVSSALPQPDVPYVTVIRPVEGLDANLYDCLTATFQQDYPPSKISVHLCIASRSAPAYRILERLLSDFPDKNVRLFVEDEDPVIRTDVDTDFGLGPNPKIRNMSRAYREAQGDIVWIIDCNVWVGRGVCGRMVDKLCGYSKHSQSGARPYKFVHQLPIVIDVGSRKNIEETSLLNGSLEPTTTSASMPSANFGSRLEELFLSSSHAKFYTAINTVAIAPCIVGKSNMFRRSHLNYLTSPSFPPDHFTTSTPSSTPPTPPGSGIDHFSSNICEDHLIGDLLWKSNLPTPLLSQSVAPSAIPVATRHQIPKAKMGNHALLLGDFAIQPLASMSTSSYIARRVRWLRVRKWTVMLATWVEPGTESFLCSAYGAFALTTLPFFFERLGVPRTWLAFAIFWLLSVGVWCAVDWTLYNLLHSGRSVEVDESTPEFARGVQDNGTTSRRGGGRGRRKGFLEWFVAWVGREALALPIWTWAFWGGTTVVWRGRRLWVGWDMKVHELGSAGSGNGADNGRSGENGSVSEDGSLKRSGDWTGSGSRSGSRSVRSVDKRRTD
ncbi:MAG: hypothetical protein Q9227_008321 [Pyrenula ochraceoflavens]